LQFDAVKNTTVGGSDGVQDEFILTGSFPASTLS